MSTFAQRIDNKRHVQLFLRWRWLVLAISIPVTLAIEILEGHSFDMRFLAEVFVDGLVAPMATWFLFTFAAQSMARRYEREEAFERRQRFTQLLAGNREYADLTNFIVSFFSTLLPIDHASLFVYDHLQKRFNFATQWNAVDSTDSLKPNTLKPLTVCHICSSPNSAKLHHPGICTCASDVVGDASRREYRLLLIHDNVQVGVLRLRCRAGETATSDQLEFVTSLTSEIAMTLALAIADCRQAERVYREARILERRRIAHELHDTLAQQVFFLHLNLDQLADDRVLLTSDATRRKVASLRDVAADVYEQIRNNLSILRVWEQVDLTEAVSELTRITAHNAGLSIDIDVQGQPGWLTPHTCEQIYSVVREALNNVVKHARARYVRLDLIWSTDHLHINLTDNGIGFDSKQTLNEGHYGLALMRESVEAMHGALRLESRPGSGTRLHVSIPLSLVDPSLRRVEAWTQEPRPILKEMDKNDASSKKARHC